MGAEHISLEARQAMRACIQKVATGPEYSKDMSFDEAYKAMSLILNQQADPVQAGVLLVALRMKRESMDEFKGVLRAILDETDRRTAQVPELVDIADPYDGFTRGLPVAPFLAPVLAALGIPAVSHGVEAVGPKYGITHRMVLRAAGMAVDLSTREVAARLEDPDLGWGYVDQRQACSKLHDLVPLRSRIVKRPCLTTVEVLLNPIRALDKTHLLTGYVHKAYPPIYAELARFAGFDHAMIVRGVEGGIVPSLQQESRVYYYHDRGQEKRMPLLPEEVGISGHAARVVPLPENLPAVGANEQRIAPIIDSMAAAQVAAELGLAALGGAPGAAYDSLVYSGAITLKVLGKASTMQAAADMVRGVLDSGAAKARFV